LKYQGSRTSLDLIHDDDDDDDDDEDDKVLRIIKFSHPWFETRKLRHEASNNSL